MDETYFSLPINYTISAQNIYDTKIGDLLKELEKKHGYDEYTNVALFFLNEFANKDSKWKAYLGK